MLKENFLKFFVIISFFLTSSIVAKCDLIINEIMQSNVCCIMDDLNDFPDSWIELYNNGTNQEILSDYSIGIKKKYENSYHLPDVVIPSDSYIIIYCDKVGQDIHTDFRLESNKEGSVFLFKGENLVDKIDHPAFLDVDISYGRKPNTNEWSFMLIPTPGEDNNTEFCEADHLLPNPILNLKGGIFYEPIFVSLKVPEGLPKDCEIRYTLNGALPNEESLLYEEGCDLEISETTTLRAKLFCKGWLSKFPVTASYIFPDHKIKMPVVSIVTDDSYLNDRNIGIYSYNYRNDWRRPANFEYFKNNEEEDKINQLVEFRISGNWSRTLPLKPLAIYANKRFGEKRLSCDFFPDELPGETNFKSILLRNSANDFYEAYMRDAVVQETVGKNMELDYQAVSSCVLYLNGKYKGIMHIRERSNEDNVFTHYNELEDIDMVENFKELKEGNFEEFQNLMTFFSVPNHSEEEFNEIVDVKELLDVHLVNLYYNNCDFPGNNNVIWKPQKEGKWRLILKDTDYAMGLKYGVAAGNSPDYKTLDWFYNPGYPGSNIWGNTSQATLFFRTILENDNILSSFIERSLIYMGDFLNSRETIKTIDKRYNIMANEWNYHSSLYDGKDGLEINENSLLMNVNYLKEWITQRDSFFPNYFAKFYGVENVSRVDIIQYEGMESMININDIPLKTGKFNGILVSEKEYNMEIISPHESLNGWKIYKFDSSFQEIPLESILQNIDEGIYNSLSHESLNFPLIVPKKDERIVIIPEFKDIILPKSICFTSNNLNLFTGEKYKLEYEVFPLGASLPITHWLSSNPDIVRIDEDGMVEALAEGNVKISLSWDNLTISCEINVTNPIILSEEISLNFYQAELNIGDELQLEATVHPEETTDKTLIWNSSDDSIVMVSETGLVTAVAAGSAGISASCGEISAICEFIVVSEKVPGDPDETGIESLFAKLESEISIYSIEGILIKKDCKVEDLKSLSKGIYIIVSGKDRYKINI